jgi:menaquinone-9 beta-reductase
MNSLVGKQLSGSRPDPSNICIGTRGYYKGVTGFHPEHYIELHFLKELLPNYLWIFPMKEGIANVGLGMMPDQIKRSGMSVSENLSRILSTQPQLKERFENAVLTGDHQTHGLPMESMKKPLSGKGFLLTGDAASLVDPFTGEGIGNAMVSGEIASEIIADAFRKNDFSEKFLGQYDYIIDKKIRKELQLSRQIRKFATNAGLFNFVVKQVNKREKLRNLFCAMYTDLEMRKKLTSPAFYLKMVTDPLKTSSS